MYEEVHNFRVIPKIKNAECEQKNCIQKRVTNWFLNKRNKQELCQAETLFKA